VRGVESVSNGAQVNASKVDSLDPAAPETPLGAADAGVPAGHAAGAAGKRGKRPGAAP